MTDLVKRLREYAGFDPDRELMHSQAADEIESLREQLATVKKERDTFKASYLEQVELHNKTLDELAATSPTAALNKYVAEELREQANTIGECGKGCADELRNRADELEKQ